MIGGDSAALTSATDDDPATKFTLVRRRTDMFLKAVIRANDLAGAIDLFRSGANPSRPGPEGLTPLMIAAGLGQPQMVDLLLTAGADVLAVEPRKGATALHKAAQSGNPDVTRLLLDHGTFIITATVEAGRRAQAAKRGQRSSVPRRAVLDKKPRCSRQEARPFYPRSQYVSQVFQFELARIGAQESMSRKGNRWDNGVLESLFSSLKRELLDGTPFESRAVARQEIFEYIEVFYNRRRRHSTPGYLTPLEFERQAQVA